MSQATIQKILKLQKSGRYNFEILFKNNTLICRMKKWANLLTLSLGILILGFVGYHFYEHYQQHQTLPQEISSWAGLFLGAIFIFIAKTKGEKSVHIDLGQKQIQHFKKDKKISTEAFSNIQNIRIVTARKNFFTLNSGVELISPQGSSLVGLFGGKPQATECARYYQELLGLTIHEDEWILLG